MRSSPRSPAYSRRCAPPQKRCAPRRPPPSATASSTCGRFSSSRTPETINPDAPARLKLDDLPDAPGVYLYRDRRGSVIYVGKARSLKSRVRSYFQGSSSGQAPKTDALLEEIHDLEYIVTRTEVEALILENNLIKKDRPRYNIRLRDDKNFPYLKMTTNERFPRVVLVRRARLDGNAYFGPYVPASTARRSIQMVARHFKVPTCYLEDMDGTRPSPCLLFQLNQGLGPVPGP